MGIFSSPGKEDKRSYSLSAKFPVWSHHDYVCRFTLLQHKGTILDQAVVFLVVYCLPRHPSGYSTGAVRSLHDDHQEFRSADDDFVFISSAELFPEDFQV